MIEWVTAGLAALSLAGIVWALKERRETKDLEIVCVCLGSEYEKVCKELAQRGQPVMNVVEQKTRWLN